mmetsp:Transcript_160/g.507  ORF Transcript_160/g.507 Transcript_160/m.507 type:complete len:86 (+) Transcript_160:119-376(+)
MAKPHRCNDRLEDLIEALFQGNPLQTVPEPWRLFTECLRSEPGKEPREPFIYLKQTTAERHATERTNKTRFKEQQTEFSRRSSGE